MADSDEFDFRAINERIMEFQSDPLVKEVLNQGIDPRTYARNIDRELQSLERGLVKEYLNQTNLIFSLNDSIVDIETVLNGMQQEMLEFKDQISALDNELSGMLQKSELLTEKLKIKTV